MHLFSSCIFKWLAYWGLLPDSLSASRCDCLLNHRRHQGNSLYSSNLCCDSISRESCSIITCYRSICLSFSSNCMCNNSTVTDKCRSAAVWLPLSSSDGGANGLWASHLFPSRLALSLPLFIRSTTFRTETIGCLTVSFSDNHFHLEHAALPLYIICTLPNKCRELLNFSSENNGHT